MAAFTLLLAALGAPPSVRSILPPSLQRGVPTRLTISGYNLGPATRIVCFPQPAQRLVSSSRFEAVVECTMPASTPPGVVPVFVAGDDGVSTAFPLAVGGVREVALQPPGKGRIQRIDSLPTAVAGVLAEKEAAVFEFRGQKGDRILAEVLAQRFGSELDPTLTLLDAAERPLVVSEDEPGLEQDSRIVATLPADGVYRLRLHDAAYGPGGRFRLSIGKTPPIQWLFPIGGKRGSTCSLTGGLDGRNASIARSILIEDPDRRNRRWLSGEEIGAPDAWGVWLDVDDPPDAVDSAKQPIPVPAAVNGRFRREKESTFTFRCKPGDPIRAEIRSADLGWATDASLRCIAGGKELARGDDVVRPPAQVDKVFRRDSADAAAAFTAAGSEFQIAVSDLLHSEHPYRLAVTIAEPEFDLRPDNPAFLGKSGEAVAVPILVRRGDVRELIDIQLSEEAQKSGWSLKNGAVGAGSSPAVVQLTPPAGFREPTRVRMVGVASVRGRRISKPVHHEVVWRQTRDVVQQSWDLPYVLVVPRK